MSEDTENDGRIRNGSPLMHRLFDWIGISPANKEDD